jgi:putative PIN family toxin of toxin-antitoxin system
LRVVLDTNVLLAAFATHGLCEAVLEQALAAHQLVLSEHILDEVGRHLAGKFRMPPVRVREIAAFLREQGEVVEPGRVRPGTVKDATDLPVLGTAAAGNCGLLVTGDAELLRLGEFEGIPIVSPRECFERFEK